MLRRAGKVAKRSTTALGQPQAGSASCRDAGLQDSEPAQSAYGEPGSLRVILCAMSFTLALGRSVAAGLCTLVLLATATRAAPPMLVPVGQVVPDLKMAGLNGPQRSLASFRGRPLIINVWASWCSPCRKEAASLERLAGSEHGARYTIVGISTDDDRNAALAWLRQSNATLSHYIDSAPYWPLEKSLGASSIPLTVLVDAKGRVVGRVRGARDWYSAESLKLIERTFADAARGAAPSRKP